MKWFEKLKESRMDAGWSLRHAAEIADVSNPILSQIENGRIKNPGFFTMWKILMAYSLEPYDMFFPDPDLQQGDVADPKCPGGPICNICGENHFDFECSDHI